MGNIADEKVWGKIKYVFISLLSDVSIEEAKKY